MAMGPSFVVGFFFLFFLLFGVANANDCLFSIDGASYDLTGANTENDLTAKDAAGNNYFFQVCRNTVTNCSCPGCTQTPACQMDNNNNLHSLGQLGDPKAFLSAVGNLQLQYLGGQKNRSVQFNLTCDPEAEVTQLLGLVTEPPGQPIYYIRVATKFACPTSAPPPPPPPVCDWTGRWNAVDEDLHFRFHSDGKVSFYQHSLPGAPAISDCYYEQEGQWTFDNATSEIYVQWSSCEGSGLCDAYFCTTYYDSSCTLDANTTDCSLVANIPGSYPVPLKRAFPGWATALIVLVAVAALAGVGFLVYRWRARRSQGYIYEQA